MNQSFRDIIESLPPSFERLMAMAPVSADSLPKGMPLAGVYLFSEGGKNLYVGRSNWLRRRYSLHTRPSAAHNQASFAVKLAKEAIQSGEANYQPGKGNKELAKRPDFIKAFMAAKARIRSMGYRFVEEGNPARQALLEAYVAIALATPYNDFDNH